MQPSKIYTPFLGEKLDYLYEKLSISQQSIADQLGITTSAISHWRRSNSISKPQISVLCKCLGIGEDELKIHNMEEFCAAVEKRFNNTIGTRWKILARQHSLRGWLNVDVVEPHTDRGNGLRGVYTAPQPNQISTGIKKVTLEDGVRFRLGVMQAGLLNDELKTILLIIENPESVQFLTPEKQEPQQFKSNGYYYLPNNNTAPFYIGLPMGKHSAYFISLAAIPPAELFQKFAEKPDGYAADVLTQWIVENNINCKINSVDFLVNG